MNPFQTTAVDIPTDDGIKDFTVRKNVQFKVDDDVFLGVPNLAAFSLLDYMIETDRLTDASTNEQKGSYEALFRMVLLPSSAERFIERCGSQEEGISLEQISDIMPWLMEQYGVRPTQPSADSSDGSPSPDGGTSSMENARVVELIPEASRPSVSST